MGIYTYIYIHQMRFIFLLATVKQELNNILIYSIQPAHHRGQHNFCFVHALSTIDQSLPLSMFTSLGSLPALLPISLF